MSTMLVTTLKNPTRLSSTAESSWRPRRNHTEGTHSGPWLNFCAHGPGLCGQHDADAFLSRRRAAKIFKNSSMHRLVFIHLRLVEHSLVAERAGKQLLGLPNHLLTRTPRETEGASPQAKC